MTIGLGFQCSDGVVLACDTQITMAGVYKEHQNKLAFLECKDSIVSSCYAGSPNLALSFYRRLEQAMRVAEPNATQDVIDVISDLALEFKKKHPKEMRYEQFLFGISLKGQKAKLVRLQDSIVDDPMTPCIGIADSALVKYLTARLTWYPAILEDANNSLVLAVYIVLQAKEFIDGCGGDTSAVIIREDGEILPFMGLPIEHLEKVFANFDNGFRIQMTNAVREFFKRP
jgi:20S proteasome alpha/beta subunit